MALRIDSLRELIDWLNYVVWSPEALDGPVRYWARDEKQTLTHAEMEDDGVFLS